MPVSERELLRGFISEVAAFMDHVFAEPNKGVGAELQRAVQAASRIGGLRQAAADMVEWTIDLSPQHLRELDARLHQLSFPTLSQMRDSRYRRLRRILSGKKLRGEAEYRLLEQVLSDMASTALSEEDVRRANELLAGFVNASA